MHKTMQLVHTTLTLVRKHEEIKKTPGAFENYPNLSFYKNTTITCEMFIKH